MASETLREASLRAFLDLLAYTPLERISFPQLAEHAGLPLSELRAAYATTDDLLDAFLRDTDRQVLAEGGPDEGLDLGEPAHERLFEVLMRRLDALEPHREAVASLLRSARYDPRLALRLLSASTRSQRWMLAAAGIDATGLRGDLKARGLAVMFARLLEIWLKDEDPGLSRTMARLDEELRRGARLLGMAENLATIARFGRPPRGSTRTRDSAATRDGEADAETPAPLH
ncbi:TetR/AcrR family transcriptional regulator [Aquabacter cavernae]|uniref:TetR/AcrR family transcriptional regulator n=1 Tax=Aquabacter cavernae TaxID=2496029 RepID=UPI000F8CF629|nr:TetR/AcrR family transcriptional regulator [Aquabacter cavernae]